MKLFTGLIVLLGMILAMGCEPPEPKGKAPTPSLSEAIISFQRTVEIIDYYLVIKKSDKETLAWAKHYAQECTKYLFMWRNAVLADEPFANYEQAFIFFNWNLDKLLEIQGQLEKAKNKDPNECNGNCPIPDKGV